jgi:hypothetical protein
MAVTKFCSAEAKKAKPDMDRPGIKTSPILSPGNFIKNFCQGIPGIYP